MDLDNYNRNSNEGLHTTSIAAAWMNIVYGFGGMRSDGELLSFYPSIPGKWKGYSFRITYRNQVISVLIEKETVTLQLIEEGEITVLVYGKQVTLTNHPVVILIPEEWRG